MTRLAWVLGLLGLVAVVWACVWDRDTLAAEAEGLPKVLDVVAGRVDRNPDLYYLMRIERVLDEVSEEPYEWGLYDDLGVAYSRIGDHRAGMEWMDRKARAMVRARLTSGEEWEDAEYKRLANLGTFKLLAWFESGLGTGENELLVSGIADIRGALEINPDAHFGRERVQLAFMEALLEPERTSELFEALYQPDRWEGGDGRDEVFLEGVTGIMALGEGWELVDAFQLLKAGLSPYDAVTEHLINLKIKDLERWGHKGVLPVENMSWIPFFAQIQGQEKEVEQALAALLVNGREYRAHREGFMTAKMEAGVHPDTHEDFWEGYEAVPPVDVGQFAPEVSYEEQFERDTRLTLTVYLVGLTVGFLSVCAGGFFVFRAISRRRKARLEQLKK